MVNVIQNFIDIGRYLAEGAASFPTSVILVVMGVGLILFSTFVLAYLTAGAVLDAIIPESLGQPPQQRG